jgi:hypothetical protein
MGPIADTVDLADLRGPPVQRGAGILYGLTEDGANPPDHLLIGIGFRFNRAGGAQLDSPGGWVGGSFERRWASTLAQCRRTTALGGTFIMLVHDLYGADGTAIDRWPGDGGDWTDFDAFLDKLIRQVRESGVDLQWDLWNEPDLDLFWARPQQQYLELWERAYRKVRAELPDAVIVGPSSSCEPSETSAWWTAYLDSIRDHAAVPDIVSWHEIEGLPHGQDAVASRVAAESMLAERGLEGRPFQINEYGAPDQQNPGQSAWYLARLERSQIDGLRANWGSGQGLHDTLAGLVVRTGQGYSALADWFTYRAYASQVGQTVRSRPGAQVDVFACLSGDRKVARLLVGNHGGLEGRVLIDVAGIETTAIAVDGPLRVVVQHIPNNNGQPIDGLSLVSDTTIAMPQSQLLTMSLDYSSAKDAFFVTLAAPDPQGGPAGDAGEMVAGPAS